jgi:hypothetical protein
MRKNKCCGCKARFPADTLIDINGSKFHSFECASEYANAKGKKLRVKTERAEKKENRKAVRELDRKDVRWQHKQTQPAFNRMRVLEELKWFSDRGLEPVCISCQKPLGGDQWCCGHNKTSGGNSRITYDPKNTFLQHNYNCNQNKSGDIEGYKKGLVWRFGDSKAKDIIAYCEENRHAKKWDWEELEKMRKGFNKRIRELEKGQ